MSSEAELAACRRATWFVDSDHPRLVARSRELTEGAVDDRERAVRLFYAVRDGLRYDPYSITAEPGDYRASHVLEQASAYCIPKAVLLTALARAAGIPARLGFADVRNHLASERLLALLQTDLFIFHGYTEFWLAGRWVKATPAFNVELCQRFGVHPLEFDGRADSLFHEFSVDGERHMEYVSSRGSYQELPFAEIIGAFEALYGSRHLAGRAERRPDELYDASGAPSPSPA